MPRLVWATAAAARHHLYPMRCLPQALCLRWLLGRHGIAAELRIGVARRAASCGPTPGWSARAVPWAEIPAWRSASRRSAGLSRIESSSSTLDRRCPTAYTVSSHRR